MMRRYIFIIIVMLILSIIQTASSVSQLQCTDWVTSTEVMDSYNAYTTTGIYNITYVEWKVYEVIPIKNTKWRVCQKFTTCDENGVPEQDGDTYIDMPDSWWTYVITPLGTKWFRNAKIPGPAPPKDQKEPQTRK